MILRSLYILVVVGIIALIPFGAGATTVQEFFVDKNSVAAGENVSVTWKIKDVNPEETRGFIGLFYWSSDGGKWIPVSGVGFYNTLLRTDGVVILTIPRTVEPGNYEIIYVADIDKPDAENRMLQGIDLSITAVEEEEKEDLQTGLPIAQQIPGQGQGPETVGAVLDRIGVFGNVLFAVFMSIGLIFLIWGALQFVIGGPSKVEEARGKMIWGVAGVLFALLSVYFDDILANFLAPPAI